MKSTISPQPQSLSLEDQLVGIEAKTAPYPAARSWSGGRRRIVGKGPLESYCYHAMSRTCGGEVHFDDVEKEALRRLLWKMSEFCGVKVVTYCVMSSHFHGKDARHSVLATPPFLAPFSPMKSTISPQRQSLSLEDQLVGIEAKTAPYPAARSWSGGRRRIVGKGPLESYCYHAMSRTCGGEVHFDDVEKEALRRLLWKMSEFCGVKVVTYCVMSNHFHVLVEVPWREVWLRRFEGPEGEQKLMEHLRTLYSRTFVGLLTDELADLRSLGMTALAEEKVEAIKKRFCDLSVYVKEVKERFSRWFNKRRGRKGTLWMDRFKSVLVEGRGEPLHTMAAYIDLNPVRAGLVKDPKDYRWCGYAEALGGSRRAQRAMSKVTSKPVDGWESAGGAEAYRKLLYSHAVEVRSVDKSKVVRRGVSAEESKAVLEAKGKLTAAELVRLRVRYFSDGLAIGGKEFVERIFGQHRDKFGPKRKDGARKIAESAGGLFALRRLRKRAVAER